MPKKPSEPEYLPPRSARGASLFTDESLNYISHILDDFLRIPGTNIRFGLDGIVGLIPGIGDIIGAMASWIIVLAAWTRGIPNVTLLRMLANIAIETIVGSIPLLGDAFDIAWKANRKNFGLLERASREGRRGTHRDWGFLVILVISMMLLLAIPLMVLAWLAGHFFAKGMHH